MKIMTPEEIDRAIERGEDLLKLYRFQTLTPEQIDQAFEWKNFLAWLYRYQKLSPSQIDRAMDIGMDLLYLYHFQRLSPSQIDRAIEKGEKLDYLYEYQDIPKVIREKLDYLYKYQDIPKVIREKRRVTLPISAKEALYGMQQEPSGYEWGGGIDFEIVKGQPQVERILAYLGEEGKVPMRALLKYEDDVEVQFHTHPNRDTGDPSKEDIGYFINSKQQIAFIIARNEICIFEKTLETPKVITAVGIEKRTPGLSYYYEDPEKRKFQREMIEREYHMKITVLPRKSDIAFDLNIVRELAFEYRKSSVTTRAEKIYYPKMLSSKNPKLVER